MAQFKYGIRYVASMHDHFSDEVNTSICISVAERLKESLNYRRKISISFEVFFEKPQEMFNIFENHNEPMTWEENIKFMLKKE